MPLWLGPAVAAGVLLAMLAAVAWRMRVSARRGDASWQRRQTWGDAGDPPGRRL